MELDDWLLDIIVCPSAAPALRVDDAASELVCTGCGLAYPVRDNIPVLLVDEARRRDAPGGRRRSWRHGVNTPHGGGRSLAALRLDDPEMVEAGDPGGMLRQVASSAAQVRTALRACAEADLSALQPDTRPRAIVVAGSGGAAAPRSPATRSRRSAASGRRSRCTGVSGYQLPGWVGAADLVIAVSRSGQTAEALALAAEAARRGCDLVGVGAPGSPLQRAAAAGQGHVHPGDHGGPARAMPWALTVPLLVVGCQARRGAGRRRRPTRPRRPRWRTSRTSAARPASRSSTRPSRSRSTWSGGSR